MPYLTNLAERIVKYEIWTSIGWILLWLICLMTSVIVFLASFKSAKANNWDDYHFVSFVNIISGIAMCVFGIVLVIVSGFQFFDIIETITIPEKTIYDLIKIYL